MVAHALGLDRDFLGSVAASRYLTANSSRSTATTWVPACSEANHDKSGEKSCQPKISTVRRFAPCHGVVSSESETTC